MPKYYTPPSRIRFANIDTVAFKKLAMTVEVCVQVTSDRGHSSNDYSGVVRFRKDDWKRYTTVWLYGDSVDTDVQDFVQPSISDVSCSTYHENYRVTSPVTPDPFYITGSNFISGTRIFIDGLEVSSTFIDRNHIQVNLTGWSAEDDFVTIRAVRPDYRTSSLYAGFSFENRPTVSSASATGTFIDGHIAVEITGAYFKHGSNIVFTSGTASVWSNNSTLHDPQHLGTFTPAMPATGVYAFQVQSPSSLSSSIVGASHITVSFRRPEIHNILPYNTGSIVGSGSFSIIGAYFLSGALVYFDATASLSQNQILTNRIDVISPAHASGVVNVTVQNPQDGQTSVGFPFNYVVPIPTIADVHFSGSTVLTEHTGSVGATLLILGTNFTGSNMPPVERVSLISGAFVTASTNFAIVSPTEIDYNIPTLTTGSHYDVEISNSAGTATLPNAFEYQDVPVVTSISPVSGTTAGGLFVLINGRPFYPGASQAKFSGNLGVGQTVYSINQMSALTPQAGDLNGGLVRVSVQNYGSVEGGLDNAFEYVPFPTASYIRSVKGNNRVPSEVVSNVTLVGTRLLADKVGARGTTVQLSSQSGSIITSFIDKTQVSFNVQPHAAGFIDLTATNREIFDCTGTLANAIEYVNTPTISSISQNAVVVAGGTTIGVTGTNFINSTDTTVLVGTQLVAATVTNSTHLSFVTPALAAATYDVTVVNRATTVSNIVPLQYVTSPQITALSIAQGPSVGGTTVVVNGVGFISGSTMMRLSSSVGSFTESFGSTHSFNTTLTPAYISPTQVSFVTPPTPFVDRGYMDVSAIVLGLNSNVVTQSFFYEEQPSITSLNPTTALQAGTKVIAVTGSHFVNGITTLSVDNIGVGYTYIDQQHINFTAPAHAVTSSVPVKVANTFLSATVDTLRYAALDPPVISNIVVGGIVQNTSGQAKWSTAGGLPHSYNDQLWGVNFTPADVISIIPFDGSPTITPITTFIDATKLSFIMQGHAVGQGYIVVSNVNGTSNYAQMRWNPYPTFSNNLPTFGSYLGNTVIFFTGSNFVSGETFVGRVGTAELYPATVLSSTLLGFTLPSTSNALADQSPVQFSVFNSTSFVPGWSGSYYNAAEAAATGVGNYKTVHPPSITSLLFDVAQQPTAGGTQFLIVPNDITYIGNAGAIKMYWFIDNTATPVSQTNYNTTKYPGNTGSLAVAPPHVQGTTTVWLGYTNESGIKILGNGFTGLQYAPPPPIVISTTNSLSSNVQSLAAGYMGSVPVSTSPPIYMTVSGGVPPYSASAELNADYSPYGDPMLPLVYSNVFGIRGVSWNGNVNYLDTSAYNSASYRWKVVDSINTTAYSSYFGIYYSLTPYSGGGGGGGGGGECMEPNTPILVAPGKLVPMKTLKIGDLVWTKPDAGGEFGYHMITGIKNTTNLCQQVDLFDGRSFVCSINHMINVNGLWRRADSLKIGEELNGEPVGIIKAVTYLGEGPVMQLTIPTAKTYFAGQGVWQHNAMKA